MSDNCFKRFTGESFGAAILDSDASKTVCGRMWVDCYNESLSGKEKEYPCIDCWVQPRLNLGFSWVLKT